MHEGLRRMAATLLGLSIALGGCAASSRAGPAAVVQGAEGTIEYQAPPLAQASFHAEAAQTADGIAVDVSCVAQGYVAVSAKKDGATLKLQVQKDEATYNYDLPSDGTPTVYVLQSGNGSYKLRVLENVTGNKYAQLTETTVQVTLENEFAPFLRPNQMVNYNETSACVAKAAELAQGAADDVEVVAQIYDYIATNVCYDTNKAKTVESGYLPDPDATLASGSGICFDYASLAAAMLRSQGIPTKVITGYVSPGDLYHAWNMIYLQDSGWITVELQAPAKEWERLDLTFAAGSGGEFAGDGTSYTDRFVY